MATYVDTNVLLRLLLNDNPEQRTQGLKVLRAAPTESVVVLDAVLVEIVFQLESPRSYGIDREEYLPHLILLLQVECFSIVKTTWNALDLLAKHPKLDYTDCLLLASIRAGKIGANDTHTLLTFDRELDRTATTH